MDAETAKRNYFDKEFYNITIFDKLITSKNQDDQEAKKFFAKYPTIMGIYVSSNHVNVYIILFDGNIRLPSKVDIKEERNMGNNTDKLKRRYVIKPCHEEKLVLTFYEKKLKNFPVDIVFLATNLRIGNNYVDNRFCYDENGVKQKLSIVYAFSKDDFIAQWNSVVLRSRMDKSYSHEFYFPFRYNSEYPKINVIHDSKKSPIRYYTDDEYELPDEVTSESDDTPTMVSANELEFTPIPAKAPAKTSFDNIMQSLRARTSQSKPPRKQTPPPPKQTPPPPKQTPPPSLFPSKNKKKQDDDDDPHIFRK